MTRGNVRTFLLSHAIPIVRNQITPIQLLGFMTYRSYILKIKTIEIKMYFIKKHKNNEDKTLKYEHFA